MRILALAAMIVLTLALAVGGGILFALHLPQSGLWALVPAVAVTLLAIGPLMAGSFLSFWDLRRSEGSRASFRRLVWFLVATQVLGDALIIAVAIAAGAAWWLPAPFLAVGGALTVGALLLGPALQRRGARNERGNAAVGSAYSPSDRRRDIRRIVIASAATFTGMLVIMVILRLVFPEESGWREGLALASAFAALAASLTATLVVFRLARAQRALVDGDIDCLRRIGKAVVRGEAESLERSDRAIAPRYAATAWVSLAYTLVSHAGVFVALGLLQVRALVTGSDSPLTIAVLAFCAVALVVFVPMLGRQIGRIRRYAVGHESTIAG
jgi:hypothetical protein